MPSLPPAIAEERLALARIGRLATVTPAGRPHIVPVCFTLHDGRIVTAVDAKPKSTTALARLDNVRATGRASLLVDHYDEDWTRLWWVRVDGPAEWWTIRRRSTRWPPSTSSTAPNGPPAR